MKEPDFFIEIRKGTLTERKIVRWELFLRHLDNTFYGVEEEQRIEFNDIFVRFLISKKVLIEEPFFDDSPCGIARINNQNIGPRILKPKKGENSDPWLFESIEQAENFNRIAEKYNNILAILRN